jgi:subtilisin family serine protease
LKKLITLLAFVFPLPAFAADPPKIKPPTFKPVVLDAFAKSAERVDPNVAWLNVPEAWKLTRGEGVVVYVGDTGIDPDHPEFKGLKVERKNFTADGLEDKGKHGTHVAGTIAGQKEIDGIAPKVKKLVSHKVLGDSGSGTFAWMTASIREAIKEPGVYNASLGSGPLAAVKPSEFDPELRKAVEDGIAAGMIFVFAAGNDDSKDPIDSVSFPARYGEELPVVVVAAADAGRGVIADFSSRGKAVFITAPGVNVVSALPGGKYAAWDGTSMATPHVAGIAALWLSANPDVPKPERQQRFADWLKSVASAPQHRDRARGYGKPDVSKLTGTKPPPGPPPTPPADKVYTLNLADLQKQGYTSIKIDMGTANTAGQVVPVQYLPPPAPVVYGQPAPVWGQPYPAYSSPTYTPPPAVWGQPQYQQCPPGGCRPVILPGVWR